MPHAQPTVNHRRLALLERSSVEAIGKVPSAIADRRNPLHGKGLITDAQAQILERIYTETHDEDPAYHWGAFKQKAGPYLEHTQDAKTAIREWRLAQGLSAEPLATPSTTLAQKALDNGWRNRVRGRSGTMDEWPSVQNNHLPAQDAFYRAWREAHTTQGITVKQMHDARVAATGTTAQFSSTLESMNKTARGEFARNTFAAIFRDRDTYFDALQTRAGADFAPEARQELAGMLEAAIAERARGYLPKTASHGKGR